MKKPYVKPTARFVSADTMDPHEQELVKMAKEVQREYAEKVSSGVAVSIRDNLLVTIGSRAAYMDCAGVIALPDGTDGEDTLAEFAADLALQFQEADPDTNFDEFIETALLQRFAPQDKDEKPEEWFGIVRWCEEDIEERLRYFDYEPTENAVALIRANCEHHMFKDSMIEHGWHLIDCYIQENEDCLEKKSETVAGKLKATQIIWDVESWEGDVSLPSEVAIPEGMTDRNDIDEYLSELTGRCHLGYCLEEE